ncbi:hypothetical protein, partial [Vibrio lentus]|uniref:hypothetical protein n=1 Tax=Vibrio lentus TaxID=136468 RepID=UPI001E485D72
PEPPEPVWALSLPLPPPHPKSDKAIAQSTKLDSNLLFFIIIPYNNKISLSLSIAKSKAINLMNM